MNSPMQAKRLDELTVVALAFIIFITLNIFKDQPWLAGWFGPSGGSRTVEAAATEVIEITAAEPQALPPALGDNPDVAPWTGEASYDPAQIVFPYKQFMLTQGPHGMDYGHMAIDLTAGKGANIISPIYGVVTASFVDEYGNTNLILENERFTITLLHGNYTAQVGDFVELGQIIGQESNNGYTLDPYGQPCAGRDCGYHTHLNVFDKKTQANANPLDLLKPVQEIRKDE